MLKQKKVTDAPQIPESGKSFARQSVSKFFRELSFPLIAVVMSFVVGLLMILVLGKDPFQGFAALFQGAFGNANKFGDTLVTMTPLMLTGISVAFAYKCGLFNIGAEGQYIIGVLVASVVGLYVKGLPAYIHIPLTILCGMAGGAFWAFIVGALKAWLGAHEVINSIMLNYVAMFLSNYFVRLLINQGSGASFTPGIQDSAKLTSFGNLSPTFSNSQASTAIFIALAAAVAAWFLLRYTKTGYEIRATGLNRFAAEAGGIKSKKNIIVTMCIAGAFAGLAGTLFVMGNQYKGAYLMGFTGFGLDGITVALVGNNNPFGIIFSALLFGVFYRGGPNMQMIGIPKETVNIMQGIIILFVAANLAYIVYENIQKRKDTGKTILSPGFKRFFGWDPDKPRKRTTSNAEGGEK